MPSPTRSTAPRGPLSRRRFLRRCVLSLLSLAAVDGFGCEPRWLRTRRLQLSASPTVRFAYFTDLHYKGDPRLIRSIVDRINRRKSELQFAAFGGDIVEEEAHLPAALEALSHLEIPLFGVPGNHDYWAQLDFDRIDAALQRRGGRWLMDESAELASGKVHLAGYSCTHAAALEPRRGRTSIALVHYPIWADRLPPGWNAVLAGHSHGGQVRLPLLGALIKPMDVGRYELGQFETPAGPLYVSRGVGTFFLNVRFLCPPELVWVEV